MILQKWGFSVLLTILAIGFVLWIGIWMFLEADRKRRTEQEKMALEADRKRRTEQERMAMMAKMAEIRKCSSCGHPTSKIISTLERSYDTTRTETRKHTHYDTHHNETGYTETEYEVPDTRYVTVYTVKCDSCGHVWTL